ncbi:MAG TPA: HlyD family secretion protein [Thermodesulfovibrionales bacterium]|nr:HlyD family secretion protein [Thermodesulfovibrionales bacterium]
MDEIIQPVASKPARWNHKRNAAAVFVFALMAIIGIAAVYLYIQYKDTHITTDDAYVDGNISTIASRVSGTVVKILVNDNQLVKKGDILLELDPGDYGVRVNEALSGLNAEKEKIPEIGARVDAAKKQVAEMSAMVQTAKANLELQEATLAQAEIDKRRAESLYGKDAVSKEKYEKMITGYKVASAQVRASAEQVRQAETALETQKAVVKQAEASRTSQLAVTKQKEAVLETAQLNFGYTRIYAPKDGYVTRKTVELGNRIKEGQPLMAVVSLSDIFVTANYKETQLEKVRPGQNVEMKVDTFSEKTFKGKVDSIMAGTGAVFSLFPPENATGNYVKVVQRIPVKIAIDQNSDPEHILRIGMSVVPTIVVGRKESEDGNKKK